MIFKFYCDESHDSPTEKKTEPKSYVVGGFMADLESWSKIEARWKRKNAIEGVPRYHASHLNAGTWEYSGWKKSRRVRYSKEIIKILKNKGRKLHGMSCGMHVDAYRKIISSDGQVKMGHPHIICFKTLIVTIAKQMDEDGFPPEDQVAVIVDRGDHDVDAVRVFNEMKDNPKFYHRHRLATCMPGDAESFIGLQPADFIAYETFRLMHDKRKGPREMRAALSSILGTTKMFGYLFNEEIFRKNKEDIDRAESCANGLVIVPPNLDGR